jgi:hypothetical protein
VVSLALICSFARMKSHLRLPAVVKHETMPEETVHAVAEVLRRSPVLRVSEDGNPSFPLSFHFSDLLLIFRTWCFAVQWWCFLIILLLGR